MIYYNLENYNIIIGFAGIQKVILGKIRSAGLQNAILGKIRFRNNAKLKTPLNCRSRATTTLNYRSGAPERYTR